MLTEEKQKYLKDYYFNPKNAGAFGGINKVWQAIKQEKVVTKRELTNWLLEQESYTSHRPYIRKFKRPRTIVPYKDAVYASDVAYMTRYTDQNDSYGYFVVFMDMFTRFAWAYTLKTLRGLEMVETLKLLFAHNKCEKLFTDKGSEYVNKAVKAYLSKEKVHHYQSLNEKKVAHAERLIKQIKKKLTKYMKENNTHRWVDVLDDVIQGYNSTYHRIIQMSPNEAQEAEQYTLWNNQYFTKPKPKRVNKPKNTNPYKLMSGDRVKLLAERKPFDREYDEKWTVETFTIIDRGVKDGVPFYSIKDEQSDPIIGHFYEKELLKVIVPDDKLYPIEKVLRKRVRNNVQEMFVKFVGYPNKFNAWIQDPLSI